MEPPDVAPGAATHIVALVAAPTDPASLLQSSFAYCGERNADQSATQCASPIQLAADRPKVLAGGLYTVSTTLATHAAMFADVAGDILEAGFWINVGAEVTAPVGGVARALKRLQVSAPRSGASSPARNTNPVLRKVNVWSAGVQKEAPYLLDVRDAIELVPDYDTTAFESYRVLASDGSFQPRIEAAQLAWYVSVGTLNQWATQGDRSVIWTLPSSAAGTNQQFVAVLRDGRGGVAVWAREVSVRNN